MKHGSNWLWMLSALITANQGPTVSAAEPIRVEVFSAQKGSANAFLFYDHVGSLLIDATRRSQDAHELAKRAKLHGTGPETLLITHGHPDHFLGLAALRHEFPKLKILVASQAIKDDMMEFAAAAAKNNWVKDEPLMRPKSQANPDGFDYEQELEVLKGDTLSLPGGAKLQVVRITTPTEAPHETLLYSTALNALFASDLVYNGVHLWLGREVTEQAIQSWKSELQGLSAKYSRPGLKVYAGHGEQADTKVFETDINYLNEILRTVRASTSETAAKASMRKKYSSWESADFILEHSLKNLFARLK